MKFTVEIPDEYKEQVADMVAKGERPFEDFIKESTIQFLTIWKSHPNIAKVLAKRLRR